MAQNRYLIFKRRRRRNKNQLLHFFVIGQSQARGYNSSPQLDHDPDENVLMLGTTPVLIDETEQDIAAMDLQMCEETHFEGDTISVAFGRDLLRFFNPQTTKVAVTISAIGGSTLTELTKNGSTGCYERALYACTRAKAIADENGWEYRLGHIWMHGGDADNDYLTKLLAHFANVESDFGPLSSRPILYCADQFRQRDGFDTEPSSKIIQAINATSNAILSHPRYAVEYQQDLVHLTANGERHTAAYFANAIAKKLRGIDYTPLQIESVSYDDYSKQFTINLLGANGELSGTGNYGIGVYNATSSAYETVSVTLDNENKRLIATLTDPPSAGTYDFIVRANFETSLTDFNRYPDFDDDATLGYLKCSSNDIAMFNDTNTDEPYSLDKYLVRSEHEIEIVIEDQGGGDPQEPSDFRVLTDFGWTSNQTTEPFQGNQWNNVHADTNNKNLSDPLGPINLVDTQGNASGISFEQTQAGDGNFGAPGNDSGANDAGTNQDVGDYPASACNDSAFVYTGGGGLPAIWVFDGFDSAKTYDIKFWGARGAAAPRGIEIADNSDFNNSKTYDAAFNTDYNNAAVFQITGVTSKTFYLRPASGSTFGYVSVVDIKEVVPE